MGFFTGISKELTMRWCWQCAILGVAMNSPRSSLSKRYAAALLGYLTCHEERILNRAYEMGREAIARGLGVLDIARIHHEALAELILSSDSKNRERPTVEAGQTLFLEALSPFEVGHRGFREANLRLRHLNDTLDRRNSQLAAPSLEFGKSREHYSHSFPDARL